MAARIISASYRTDIPAFHGRWFLERLAVGHCQVVNPYGGPAVTVDLRPDAVAGFVFWSRNVAPFFPALEAVSAQGWPFVLQYTHTGYPRCLERSSPATEVALAQMRAIRARWGPRALVWRYDPILFSSLTPPDWHREQFARLATAVAAESLADEVVVSVMHPYRKAVRHLNAAAAAAGFTWWAPTPEEQAGLVAQLAGVAAAAGLPLTLCSQPALTGVPGTAPARCIDAARLSDLAGRPITARTKGNRPGCVCAESRDIGTYDTCLLGCVYCYAAAARRPRD